MNKKPYFVLFLLLPSIGSAMRHSCNKAKTVDLQPYKNDIESFKKLLTSNCSYEDVVNYLAQNRAINFNMPIDGNGNTFLHYAAIQKNLNVVAALLLEGRANIRQHNSWGISSFSIIKSNECMEVLTPLIVAKIVLQDE